MNKDFAANLSLTLIGGLFIVLVGVGGYFAYKLDSQSDRITKLQSKVSVLLIEFSKKNPGINIEALTDYAAAKNIPPEMTASAIQALQEGPVQGEVYMKQELKFNSSEIGVVIRPAPQMQKKLP